MEDGTQGPGVVSPELDQLVCDLIGRFLDELAEGADPGVVVSMEDQGARRHVVVFCEDGEEVCLDAAKRYVACHALGDEGLALRALERYAIAYTGAVEVEGAFRDALLVSFFERGLASGFSAYVLYRCAGSGADFSWSDPEPAGAEPPLI